MEKIELESLLKLKRNEMPTDAFWDSFDANLSLRLAQEPMPKARVSWFNYCWNWFYRSPLVSAACALTLLFSIHFLAPKPTMRYTAINNSVSVKECQKSILIGDLAKFGLEKNVIQKKMIASVASNCFSF